MTLSETISMLNNLDHQIVIYDDEIFLIREASESDAVPGFVHLEVDSAQDGLKHIRMSPVEARSLHEAIHVKDKQTIVDHFLPESATADFAIPQGFFQELADLAEGNEHRMICMVYDQDSGVHAQPQPLSREAYRLLAAYDSENGSSYEEGAVFPPKLIRDVGEYEDTYLVGETLPA